MTKGKQLLIEKCKKYGFSNEQIHVIENLQLTLKELDCVFRYICINNYKHKNSGNESVIQHIYDCVQIYNETKKEQGKKYKQISYLDYLLDDSALIYKEIEIYELYQSIVLVGQDLGTDFIYNISSCIPVMDKDTIMFIARELRDYYLTYKKYLILDSILDSKILVSDIAINKLHEFEILLSDIPEGKSPDVSPIGEYLKKYIEVNDEKGYVYVRSDTIDEIKKRKFIKEQEKLAYENPYYNSIKHYLLNDLEYTGEITIDNIDMSVVEKITSVLPDTDIDVSIPNQSVTIKISNGNIELTFREFKNIKILNNNVYGYNRRYIYVVIVFRDGGVYQKLKTGKLIPMQISSLKKNLKNEYVKKFADALFHFDKIEILKDLQKDFYECDWVVPISFNEFCIYHNRKELLQAKYKDLCGLRINFNSLNINLSYMIIKSSHYVTDRTKNLLQNIKDCTTLNGVGHGIRTGKIKEFLHNVYFYLNPDASIDSYTMRDYIDMHMWLKRKIELKFSEKRIIKEHDKLSNEDNCKAYMKAIGSLKVPAGSQYNRLRKMLPDTFEWIKTKRRLAEESVIQSHCVWSYAGKIKSDKIAIYSFLDEEGLYSDEDKMKMVRYTIEFVINKKTGEYEINQIQRKHNLGTCIKMRDYINNILNKNRKNN